MINTLPAKSSNEITLSPTRMQRGFLSHGMQMLIFGIRPDLVPDVLMNEQEGGASGH